MTLVGILTMGNKSHDRTCKSGWKLSFPKLNPIVSILYNNIYNIENSETLDQTDSETLNLE